MVTEGGVPDEPGTETNLDTSLDGGRKIVGEKLNRAVSFVREEVADLFVLNEDSHKRLQERRRLVLSRRFKLLDEDGAPVFSEQPTIKKKPVAKLAINGIQRMHRKTKALVRRVKREEIYQLDSGGPPSEFVREEVPARRFAEKDWRTNSVSQKLAKYFLAEKDDVEEYRPLFTGYVTFAQLFILIVSLSIYGFGPVGFTREHRTGLVMVTSLTLEQVDVHEPQNIWLGNREADLILLGARFTPCMRDDPGIRAEIVKDMIRENETSCCVRHDRSGCVQTQRDQCSENLSTWYKFGRPEKLSTSVCGQDPRYCNEPASIEPYKWPDDITKWPICRQLYTASSLTLTGDLGTDGSSHMSCQVVGRPCCLGTYGQCEITTREYCEFVRGTFHEEAALCSQVSCLADVCGMFPFLRSPDRPDQIYRLATSLFLHAGILHFMLSAILQIWLMRDLERIYGPVRIALIYMLSGIGGNLASAIIVPYRADVGPSASLFGILACFVQEAVLYWPRIEPKTPGNKWRVVRQFIIPIIIGIACGFTPWTDNWGNLFGLILGLIMAFAIFPGEQKRTRKRWFVILGLLFVCVMAALITWFALFPEAQCRFCHYFTCFPWLFKESCESHTVSYKPRILINF